MEEKLGLGGGVNPLHYGANALRGWIFVFAVFGCPLVYSFHFTSFLHPKEMLLLLCLALMGVLSLATCLNPMQNKEKTYSPLFLLSGYGLPVFSILAAVYPGAEVLNYYLEYIVGVAMFVMLVLWADDLISDETWLRRIWNAAIASGLVVAVLALGQYAGLLNYMFPVFPAYTQPMYSVFGNQDLLGAYLAVIVPMLLHRLLERERTLFVCALLLAVLAIMLLALVHSGSRSAWLAAVAGAALIFWWHRKRINWKRHLLPVGLCAYALAYFNSDFILQRTMQTFSDGDVGGRARLWFWDGALRMIADNPWVGVGVGNYKYWSPYYQGLALAAPGGEKHFYNTLWTDHAHNEFLEYIAETGAVGAAFLVALLYFLLRCRGVAWAPLISLAICACFTAVLHSAPHAVLGFVFCAGLLSERPLRLTPKAIKVWPYCKMIVSIIIIPIIPMAFHGFYTISYFQARAERAHVNRDSNTYREYGKATKTPHWKNYPLYESFGIALLENGHKEDALFYLQNAKEGLDTGRIHYLLGYAHEAHGEIAKASVHYEAALFRWPGDQNTFDALWKLSPPEKRALLRDHAKRFGLATPL